METNAERTSASALRGALALDPDEVSFLRSAALPSRLAALVQQRADPRVQLMGLLWVVVPAAIAYAAWLTVAPLFTGGLTLAGQVGGSALIASLLANIAWSALGSLAGIVEAASAVPGFNAPLVTLSLAAVALYAAAVLTPRQRVRQDAAAV
jgi:hypothetical protein